MLFRNAYNCMKYRKKFTRSFADYGVAAPDALTLVS